MKITFMSASIPLTKTYIKKNGILTKSSYPNAYEFTTHTEAINDLKTFAIKMQEHADQGHCLLKGKPVRDLVHESRAGNTESNSMTEWICLDVDGIPNCTAQDFMRHIKLEAYSHVVQYSASYLIENTDLKCHIFLQINKMAAPAIKQWLIQVNHDVSILRDNMSLTKTGNALHWPLDITACQNDKLLYIAPPVLRGVKDPLKDRIVYVKGQQDVLLLPRSSLEKNKDATDKRIAELRKAEGLPLKKIVTKIEGTTEYMVKPAACIMDEVKVDRGFVYFNLNGGDSWAYYHPEDNPKFIYNFKGEPAYLTKELLPEYWASLQQPKTKIDKDGIQHIMVLDRKTNLFWRGSYNAVTNILDIDSAPTPSFLKNYAIEQNLFWDDKASIPEWQMVFDPLDAIRIDNENRIINIFQPTIYMMKQAKVIRECPKRIYKVIHNVVGGDDDIAQHFINWLAFIVQKRSRTCTSWVFHGTTGTGKGVMFHRILKPLLGRMQTKIINMEQLNEQFNSFIERALLVFVDEVDAKSLNNEQGVMAKMRTFITEETIPMRGMHKEVREIQNYSNWIYSSNKTTPVSIDREDRRTNVAKYQPNKLDMSEEDIAAIEGELQAFHDFLMTYQVDIKAVRTPINTSDREILMDVSENSVDVVGSALLKGDMRFFIDQLPTSDAYQVNALMLNKVESYKKVLLDLVDRMTDNGKCNIARDELITLFSYTIGAVPESPNKFTSLLKHHRIHMDHVWVNDKTVRGIKVVFKGDKDELTKLINPPITPTPKLKAVK